VLFWRRSAFAVLSAIRCFSAESADAVVIVYQKKHKKQPCQQYHTDNGISIHIHIISKIERQR
jgi:hypothetical protein